jgi:hypothetical protein
MVGATSGITPGPQILATRHPSDSIPAATRPIESSLPRGTP